MFSLVPAFQLQSAFSTPLNWQPLQNKAWQWCWPALVRRDSLGAPSHQHILPWRHRHLCSDGKKVDLAPYSKLSPSVGTTELPSALWCGCGHLGYLCGSGQTKRTILSLSFFQKIYWGLLCGRHSLLTRQSKYHLYFVNLYWMFWEIIWMVIIFLTHALNFSAFH